MADVLEFNISQERGSDYHKTWRLLDPNKLPIALGGYALELEIRDVQGGSILLTVSEQASPTVTGINFAAGDAVDGRFQLLIKSAQVSGLAGVAQGVTRFAWGLKMTDPAGVSRVYARGAYILEPTSAV